MITKPQLLDLLQHQTNVIKHLATKIPEGQLEWRPTEGQRSTLELLRYLTVAALFPAVNLVTNDWDHAPGLNEESQSVTLETFPERMDRQMARLREILHDVDEAACAATERSKPWGEPVMQGAGFVDLVYSTLVAYRMQLFLYAKQSGNAALNSMNLWIGKDPDAQAS